MDLLDPEPRPPQIQGDADLHDELLHRPRAEDVVEEPEPRDRETAEEERKGPARLGVEQAADASGIPAADIVQKDSAGKRVAISSARAEQALRWVARLQLTHGVRLENLRITTLGDGDQVRIEAVFTDAP